MFCQEDEFELTDFEDYDDDNGEIFADPVSSSGVCVYPAACRVIYSYQVGIIFPVSNLIFGSKMMLHVSCILNLLHAYEMKATLSSSSSVQETYFGHFHLRSNAFDHYPQLVTIEEGWSIVFPFQLSSFFSTAYWCGSYTAADTDHVHHLLAEDVSLRLGCIHIGTV